MAVELEKVRTQLESDRKRQLSAAKTAHERHHQETVDTMTKEHQAALDEVKEEKEEKEKLIIAHMKKDHEEEKRQMAANFQVFSLFLYVDQCETVFSFSLEEMRWNCFLYLWLDRGGG